MRLLALLMMVWARAAGAAVTISGTVYADNDGDGAFSVGDTPVAGAVVVWGTTLFAQADGLGRYSLAIPADGIVWVSSPDGFSPAPTWRGVTLGDGGQRLDLPLTPRPLAGPLRFVQASDSHVSPDVVPPGDAAAALRQIALTRPMPHFLAICGDLTQGSEEAGFAALRQAAAATGLPLVPIPGNHDWYDGGAAYRKIFGPMSYSFDAGGVHFVVLDQSAGNDAPLAFLDGDLAFVSPGTPVAAFFHFPPGLEGDQAFVDGLARRGVKWLFTGHWHQNRVLHFDGLVNYNIQPLVMAGMDFTPGGYRVVTIAGDSVAFDPHTVVDEPVFRLVSPLPGACVPPGRLEVIAAVEAGAVPVELTAQIDDQPAQVLQACGGWDWSAAATLEGEADHLITVTLAPTTRIQTHFCTRATPLPAGPLPDWPQLQGGPAHTGATDATVSPPLRQVWATPVGGHLRGGSPVLAAGRLFVPVVDLGDGARGGLVALDALSGRVLWERRVGRSVHDAPAVSGDTVVIAIADGTVEALAADSGASRWSFDVAEGLPEGAANLFAAPTIADGVVYAGVVRNLAAIDLQSGAPLWQKNPSGPNISLDATSAALSVSSGVLVGLFGRGYEGLTAWDAATGDELWRGPADLSLATSASPIIAGDRVYTGNSATVVYQLDLMSGRVDWTHQLDDRGFGWGYWLAATPALANGQLFVPTQVDWFWALRDDSGVPLWRQQAEPAVIHPVHYRGAGARAFSSSPVVTGGIVWAGGADGILRAIDAVSGEVLWRVDLGAPILSGPVPAQPLLFVATWDGTVRALVSVPPGSEPPPPRKESGCSVGGAGRPSPLLLFFLLAWLGRLTSRRESITFARFQQRLRG